MNDLIDSTSAAISTLLEAPVSLRQLAVSLYGDDCKTSLLADVLARRGRHVSHAALHDLRRRLGLAYDVRHVVDVPHDAGATVHIQPGGDGGLSVCHVPASAQVVIVRRRQKPAPPQWVMQAADTLARLRAKETVA